MPGEPDETVEFGVSNGFFERFSNRSAFVLNPGGAATLLRMNIDYYSKDMPRPQNAGRPKYSLHFGEESFSFHDVDYAFETPPHEIEMEKGTKIESKVALSVLSEEPWAVLSMFPDGTPPQERADYLESQLRRGSANDTLLEVYFGLRMAANQLDRCREFLAEGLSKKPINIEWHRMYQETYQTVGRRAEVAAQYRKKLDAHPKDSALLYLTGRVTADAKQRRQYFEQAVEADGKNAYPQYALAYDYASAGDFAKAKPFAETACKLKPKHIDMELKSYEIRFALREYGPLENDLHQKLVLTPLNWELVERLMQVQAAAGAIERAWATQGEFVRQIEQQDSPGQNADPGQYGLQSRLNLLYLEGDMHGFLSECLGLRNLAKAASESFTAHVELGNLSEAETALTASMSGNDPEQRALLLSLAWSRTGNREKADAWRKQALEHLRRGSDELKLAATILESGKIDREEIDGLTLATPLKSLWLVALADGSPEHRQELLDYAEKLNTDTYFPHRFLKRTIEEMKAVAQ